MSLEPLFDAELRHRPGMDPVAGAADGEGQLIGSGDGTVTGPKLAGSLRRRMCSAATGRPLAWSTANVRPILLSSTNFSTLARSSPGPRPSTSNG